MSAKMSVAASVFARASSILDRILSSRCLTLSEAGALGVFAWSQLRCAEESDLKRLTVEDGLRSR